MPAIAFVLKYWREIAVALLLIILICAGLYVRSVFAERDRLKQANQVLTVQLQDAVAMQEFSNKVTEAIGQIKVRSNTYVNHIESEPAPKFVDARPIPFIAGGVSKAFGVLSSATAGGAIAAHAPGGALPAGEPAGGVLPDRSRAP